VLGWADMHCGDDPSRRPDMLYVNPTPTVHQGDAMLTLYQHQRSRVTHHRQKKSNRSARDMCATASHAPPVPARAQPVPVPVPVTTRLPPAKFVAATHGTECPGPHAHTAAMHATQMKPTPCQMNVSKSTNASHARPYPRAACRCPVARGQMRCASAKPGDRQRLLGTVYASHVNAGTSGTRMVPYWWSTAVFEN